jgi:methionine-rich copper-binding protein CopC
MLFTLTGLLALGLMACSSDDDPVNPGGGGDTTAPQVAGIDPTNGETGVGQTQDIVITFSEAMDPATAAGHVTLSAGAVSDLTWDDDRNLRVEHSAWAEGVQVMVTVTAGLTDAAGNTLAAAFTSSFWVFSSSLQVLETNPADGATGVNRSSSVQVLFSGEVNEGSMAANTTITSGVVKVDHAFTITSDGSAVTLMITDDLPASTEITVTVGANVAAPQGGTLGSDYVFSFTTGVDVDITPPTIVSVNPAIGSTVPANVGIFQITFSEPIDPNSFTPTAWNVEFALALLVSDPTPTWSADNTMVTVPLPSPLPAGLPMEITFGDITDQNGNPLSTPWTWHAKIAGTADYFPMVDGLEQVFGNFDVGGVTGNPVPQWSDGWTEYLLWEEQGNGTFRQSDYSPDFSTPLGDYDIYRKIGNAVQWVGFRDSGSTEAVFDTPLNILPLPLAAGTWNSGTSVTIPGEGDFTASLSGTVVGQSDLETESFGSEEMFFKDAWQVIRVLNVEMDGSTISVETDTTYYAATLGVVQHANYEDQVSDGEWSWLRTWRIFDVFK